MDSQLSATLDAAIESPSASAPPPMPLATGKPWILSLLAGGLIAVFLVLLFLESSMKSPVYDEPPHIASGLSYVETRVFLANPEHPPLLKEMSAVSLLLAGIRWPKTPEAEQLIHGDAHGQEWSIGNSIVAENGPDRVLFWARLPFILVASLLGVLIYVWGRQMTGALAAVGAVFLYVLDPTVIGHAFLVTTDTGLAAFGVLFIFAMWNYIRYPTIQRLLLCGLAMGGVLCTKFSAVFLLPAAGLLLLAGVIWPPEPAPGRRRTFLDPYFSGTTHTDGETVAAGQGLGISERLTLLTRAVTVRSVALCVCAFLAMSVLAIVVIQVLYFSPRGPLLYLNGIRSVDANHVQNYQYYMAGQLANHFTSYFAVAYLLKEPIASIALVVIGIVALLRSRKITTIQKLFLLLPPAALFAGYTIFADELGFRYMIPVLPFAYLIGGLGLATLIESRAKWGRYVAGILCAWLILAAAGVYPDHLSYFNESACLLKNPSQMGLDGGTRCGPLWLDDSNVDYGQGLKQFKAWADRNAGGRNVRLAYQGSFPPAGYGLAYEGVGFGELTQDSNPVPGGLYVVSAHLLARVLANPGSHSWMNRTPPVAIIGHTLYVYDVPKSADEVAAAEEQAKQYPSPEKYLSLSLLYYQRKRYQDSIAACREALKLRPDYADAYNNMAAAYNELGMLDEAIQAEREALRIKPDYPLAKNNLAFSLSRKKSLSDQLAAAAAEAKRAPSPEKYLNLSLLYFQAERYEDSIAACREALKLRPDFPDAYNNIAAAYGSMGRWDDEIKAAQRALQLKPDYPLARNNLHYAQNQKRLKDSGGNPKP
jgi:tetratricopeptide (TPR) repeat protein